MPHIRSVRVMTRLPFQGEQPESRSTLQSNKMTELYNCFLEKRYPEEWDVDWRENTHYSLGLFLVHYLGNGFNLADAAHLTYNGHYFSER